MRRIGKIGPIAVLIIGQRVSAIPIVIAISIIESRLRGFLSLLRGGISYFFFLRIKSRFGRIERSLRALHKPR